MRKQSLHQVTGLDQGQELVNVRAEMQTQDSGGRRWSSSRQETRREGQVPSSCWKDVGLSFLVGYPGFTKYPDLGFLIPMTGCHGNMALKICSSL